MKKLASVLLITSIFTIGISGCNYSVDKSINTMGYERTNPYVLMAVV